MKSSVHLWKLPKTLIWWYESVFVHITGNKLTPWQRYRWCSSLLGLRVLQHGTSTGRRWGAEFRDKRHSHRQRWFVHAEQRLGVPSKSAVQWRFLWNANARSVPRVAQLEFQSSGRSLCLLPPTVLASPPSLSRSLTVEIGKLYWSLAQHHWQ